MWMCVDKVYDTCHAMVGQIHHHLAQLADYSIAGCERASLFCSRLRLPIPSHVGEFDLLKLCGGRSHITVDFVHSLYPVVVDLPYRRVPVYSTRRLHTRACVVSQTRDVIEAPASAETVDTCWIIPLRFRRNRSVSFLLIRDASGIVGITETSTCNPRLVQMASALLFL
jgi:hypothetical protein